MIKLLRIILFPMSAFFIISIFACGEWSKVFTVKRAAQIFYKDSKILVFKRNGSKEWQGRAYPIYDYDLDGKTMEFPTHSELDLASDGRVRMGLDPLFNESEASFNESASQLVIPIKDPDSEDTIYTALRGHEIGEDITKATVLSAAAMIAGIAGFILQRIILRDVRRAYRSRW